MYPLTHDLALALNRDDRDRAERRRQIRLAARTDLEAGRSRFLLRRALSPARVSSTESA